MLDLAGTGKEPKITDTVVGLSKRKEIKIAHRDWIKLSVAHSAHSTQRRHSSYTCDNFLTSTYLSLVVGASCEATLELFNTISKRPHTRNCSLMHLALISLTIYCWVMTFLPLDIRAYNNYVLFLLILWVKSLSWT